MDGVGLDASSRIGWDESDVEVEMKAMWRQR